MNAKICNDLGLKATFYDQMLTRTDLNELCLKHKVIELLKRNICLAREESEQKILEKVGFCPATANKIIQISTFASINQFTIFDCIECYVTIKFRMLQADKAIDRSPITWFKPTIDLNLSSKLYYLKDVKETDPSFMYWYHGTTNLSANEIRNYGINVNCNNSYKNFGHGFYLTDNSNLALDYAEFTANYMTQLGVPAKPSVLVFEIPLVKYESILRRFRVKNLSNGATEWIDVIKFYALCHQELPLILGKNPKNLRQIEAIIGPQMVLKSRENINKIFSRKTKSLQLCIKRQQFADEFLYLSRIYYFK